MKKVIIALILIASTLMVLVSCSTEKQCKATFVSDGETAFSMTLASDTSISEPQLPVKDGYRFLGWSVKGSLVEFPYVVTKDTIFEAVWEIEGNKITLDLNGGAYNNGESTEMTIVEGEQIDTIAIPKRDGFSFVGWMVNGVIINLPYTPSEDVTFVALWMETICKHMWNQESTTATCEAAGVAKYKCFICGENKEQYEAAVGHTYERANYDGVTGKVTDNAAGVYIYTCQDCGEQTRKTIEKIDTKTDKSQKWSGKTLDILASGWGQDDYGATSGWSQPELYVNSAIDYRYMGTDINSAVWARQLRIQKDYGVTMKWHQAKSNASMLNELQSGLEAGFAKYHLATPRAYEAQALIAAEAVYDLANSKYIDLTKSYYNQSAVDSYSVYGHTFYVSGDFSYLDEYTASVLFYNQAMVESEDYEIYFGNLYNKVRNGKWTLAELIKLCSVEGLAGNIDNNEGLQDTDAYTFAAGSLSGYFQASRIQQVSVDKSSGDKNTYCYRITLNDNPTAVASLVSELVKLRDSEWSRSSWEGGYGAMLQALTSGRVLFYQEVVQKIFEFPAQTETFKIGVLPLPMLNEDQDGYATAFTSQATLLCIPKCTLDKGMSEYFLDVLSWTGQDYVMRAFVETLESKLYDDGETSREDALEMLTDYIFPNIIYDQGYIFSSSGTDFMTSVQNDTISRATSSSSDFTTLYTEAFKDANDKLNHEKTGWNTYAKKYRD